MYIEHVSYKVSTHEETNLCDKSSESCESHIIYPFFSKTLFAVIKFGLSDLLHKFNLFALFIGHKPLSPNENNLRIISITHRVCSLSP